MSGPVTRHSLRLALIAALAVPGVARADRAFLLPSSTLLAGDGNVVTFDAAGSDHVFFFDHRPLPLSSILIRKPDGTSAVPYNTLQGRFRSVFDVKLDQQGTWKIASQQMMIVGSFKENGEDRRVGGRGVAPKAGTGGSSDAAGGNAHGDRTGGHDAGAAPSGGDPRRQPPIAVDDIPADATDIHLTESVARVETFVTEGAPTTGVFKPEGNGIELDPITHPNAVVWGETARFRLLIDGRPASGVKVTVVPGGDRYRDDAGAVTLATGVDGVVAVTWPTAGMYWLSAEAEDRNASDKRAETRRMSYSATLEVMTP